MKLAGCIIRDEQGRILLLHRNTDKWQHWEVPGGKLEDGEDPAAAATREIKEELRVDVEILKRLGDREFREKDYTLHYTWFEAKIISGRPKIGEPDKFDKLNYFSLDEMSKADLSAGAATFLSMGQEVLSKKTQQLYQDPHFAVDYANTIEDLVNEKLFRTFKDFLPPSVKVLDVGCAAGRDSNYLSRLGYETVGIDLAEPLIAEARKRHPSLNFVVGDFMELPFADGSFDGVWAQACLVHCPSQQTVKKALQEFKRVLKTEGVLCVITKARLQDEPETTVRKDKLSHRERYFRFQEKNAFEALLKEVGFVVETSEVFPESDIPGRDPARTRNEKWLAVIARNQ